MITTPPQLALTHIVDAPRALVYQAFTDPDHFAAWWGPIGNSLPRNEIEFDVRPGVRIPRGFHLYSVPSDIVTVVPAYRGYRFFYYEDELVIVDPVTLEIVAVIPA